MASAGVLVFLFISCLLTSCSLQECIVPDGGSQKPPPFCKTINQFCENAGNILDSTVVNVLSGTHRLNMTCEMQNLSNIMLIGLNVTIKCSQEESGFRFVNVSMLKISGIEFIGCGVPWPEALGTYALLFIAGSNLTLTNITVSYPKFTGLYINDVAGTVTVDSCKLANAPFNRSGCELMDINIIKNGGNIMVFGSEVVSLTINNSLIINGGSGCFAGGLTLLLANPKMDVTISNTIISENIGTGGGNIAVVYFEPASVFISNSTFIGGLAKVGGGAYVLLNCANNVTESFPVLSIINSTFTNNKADANGGGIYVTWSQLLGSAYIGIINSSFTNNNLFEDGGGLALGLLPLAQVASINSDSTFNAKVNLSRCNFSNHIPDLFGVSANTHSVISATSVSYLGIDGITIKSNNCTAIMATRSKIVFSGSTIIFNNTAVTGGGLQLANAMIILAANTNVTITNNSVQQTGGGVQIYRPPTGCLYMNCLYQISGNATLTIKSNHALGGGDNVFGDQGDCNFDDNSNGSVIPQNTLNEPSSISSLPQKICFDILSEMKCDNTKSIGVYPGEMVTIFIRLVGSFEGSVSGTVSAIIAGGVAINDTERSKEVGISGQNISYTVYSLTTYKTKASLTLQPVKTECDFAVNAQINIFFRPCPFGFNITNIRPGVFTCQCDSIPVILICSIDSQTIIKSKYSWIGMFQLHNHSYLATNDYCPLDYCDPTFQSIKSHSDHLDQDEQCQYNRTGILCGACRDGWSLVLGSSECREKCSNVWLLLIVPFALAGLLLVVVIHFLNLTVTMGTVCGLIFYANIVQDYSTAFLSTDPIPGLTPILQIFLSWLNLDLGISTCFYNGMEAFGKAMLLFIFPIYIWLISATIIILSNRYIFFTKWFGETAPKILSTLILLSYSKMFRVAIGILNLKSINVYIDNSSPISKVRWALDGNIPYFDLQRHLVLFMIAVLFVMLLLPFSLSLFCIKQVYSLSNYCRVFSWIDKLKPFFDTYTGPFEDKARFWTGFLLFVRLFLLIVYSPDYRDNLIPYYIVIAVCFLLLSIMISFHGVYIKKFLNILEHFFIVNIGILFLINAHKGGSDSLRSISSHLLVSSAFLAFLGIVAYHAYLKFFHFKKIIWLRPQNADINYDRLSCEGMRGYEPVEQDLDIITQ